jgi:hypothetical protein
MKTITIQHFQSRTDGNIFLVPHRDNALAARVAHRPQCGRPAVRERSFYSRCRKTSIKQPRRRSYDMSFRFITKSIHAYLIDYPVAIVLMGAPFLLKLGQSGPAAVWLSLVTGVAALMLPALTDHPTGLVPVIPYWLHLWVDRAVGVVFIIAPFAFHFTGLDAWYYWVLAVAVLLTTSVLNAPEVSAAQRANFDTRTAL